MVVHLPPELAELVREKVETNEEELKALFSDL